MSPMLQGFLFRVDSKAQTQTDLKLQVRAKIHLCTLKSTFCTTNGNFICRVLNKLSLDLKELQKGVLIVFANVQKFMCEESAFLEDFLYL